MLLFLLLCLSANLCCLVLLKAVDRKLILLHELFVYKLGLNKYCEVFKTKDHRSWFAWTDAKIFELVGPAIQCYFLQWFKQLLLGPTALMKSFGILHFDKEDMERLGLAWDLMRPYFDVNVLHLFLFKICM